jgi:hypothetical protein
MSLAVVIFAAYQGTSRKFGFVSLEHSGYFIGACVGPYLVSAIIVLIYRLIRGRKVNNTTNLFALFCGASFFAVLSLLNSAHATTPMPVADATFAPQTFGQPLGKPNAQPLRAPTIWDPAVISLYTDLKSANDTYVAAVSRLDVTAQSLYMPDSFRDTPAIQKILAQLHDRMAVADQFSSLDPILAKMPSYVAAIDASETDKREFLANFMPTARRSIADRNTASAYEHDWLRASIALYQFMLAKQGAYAISSDGAKGTFYRPDVSSQFQNKIQNVQRLKQRFLQANQAYLANQSAARAQLGMAE